MADTPEPTHIELNIFDFDGTIFRSPCPSPKLWDGPSLGKLKASPDPWEGENGGYGWFQNPITLAPPAVPENPDESYFIAQVVERIKLSMANKPHFLKGSSESDSNTAVKCYTVLLTGRSEPHRPLIRRITEAQGLLFDDYGLKPLDTKQTTMEFKQAFITSLVLKYKPTQIEIFDDRERHVVRLRDFAKKQFPKIPSEVHHIVEEGQDTILPKQVELDLIKQLATHIGKPFNVTEKTDYTAVMLDDASTEKLLAAFPPEKGWAKYAHHMTVCLGPIYRAKEIGLSSDDLGKQYTLKVEAIGKSEKAFAARVSGCGSTNQIAHVTIAVGPNGKPVDSNFIVNWAPVPAPIELIGTLDHSSKLKLVDDGDDSKRGRGGRGGRGRGGRGRRGGGGQKLHIAPLVTKHHPDVHGNALGDAVQQITEWMSSMNLNTDTSSLPQVEEFIKTKSFGDSKDSKEAPQ